MRFFVGRVLTNLAYATVFVGVGRHLGPLLNANHASANGPAPYRAIELTADEETNFAGSVARRLAHRVARLWAKSLPYWKVKRGVSP